MHSGVSAWVDHLETGFSRALIARGEHREWFRLAGRTVLLRYAGARWSSLSRPLTHARIPASADDHSNQPDLELRLWECGGDFCLPRPPSGMPAQLRRGEIVGLNAAPYQVHCDLEHQLLNAYDPRRRVGLYCAADLSALPFWEAAAPYRNLFHWWANGFGAQLTHAAAVGVDGQGVLLAGRGGSGKSTTTLACLDAGLTTAGDDYILLELAPRPVAHCLYSAVKAHGAFLKSALPAWAAREALVVGPERKVVVQLDECAFPCLTSSLEIQAILAPAISTRPQAELEPLSSAEITRILAPSTLLQLPGARGESLHLLARCAARLPGYRLWLSPDLASAPERIRTLLNTREYDFAAPAKRMLHAG